MRLEGVQVAYLEEPAVERTAHALATAFEVDAAYRYLFPDARTRSAGLADFFARNLRTHLPHRCTFVAFDISAPPGTPPIASVTLRPPGGIAISTLTLLRRGLIPFALAHGRGAVKRLFWLKSTYDALESVAAEGAPHWYVHMMAVRADRQGQGFGSALLERVLDTHAHGTAPIVLTTHLERNVAFYRRAGFAVVSEQQLSPPDSSSYTVWSMRREGAL